MTTLFPLISGALPPAMEFIPVLVIGVLFGMALEVAGFGNAKILASQFYFHDMRVFKVMFAAIITCAAGIALLTATGLLDMDLLYIPDTFLVPLGVGGFILGMGFMISAYCPGTSIVGAASGKLDGLVAFTGVVIGSVLFGMITPYVNDFYMSTAKGVLTFPKLLGVRFPILAAILIAVAVLLFLMADRVEGIFAKKFAMPEGQKMTRMEKKALGVVFSLSILAVLLLYLSPADLGAVPAKQASILTPVELAQMLIEKPRSLYVVDLRPGAACKGDDRIPQAACFGDIKDTIELMYKDNTLVAYSQTGKETPPEALFKYKGKIALLDGGYDEWRSTVIGKPEQVYEATLNSSGADRKKLIVAIHAFFTGAKVEAQAESNKPGVIISQPKKKSGGCS